MLLSRLLYSCLYQYPPNVSLHGRIKPSLITFYIGSEVIQLGEGSAAASKLSTPMILTIATEGATTYCFVSSRLKPSIIA